MSCVALLPLIKTFVTSRTKLASKAVALSLPKKVVGELIGAFQRLADLSSTARLGTRAPQVGKDVRLFSVSRWVVIYRYVEDGVLVLRVADGSQDYMPWKIDQE